MTEMVAIQKDEERATPVPSVWRQTFCDVVDAMREHNYALVGIKRVEPLDEDTALAIARNIEAYGGNLVSLPEETWQGSICQWQLTYWEVLVDLFTLEGPSDLVLHTKVFEQSGDFVFKVHFVYVP